MAEYSKIASGYFTYGSSSSGVEKVINLPFSPQIVEVWNVNNWSNPVSGNIFYSWWNPSWGAGGCTNSLYTSGLAQTNSSTSSGGITVFSPVSGVVFGAPQQIVSMTAASNPVVTVTGHGYSNGDVVMFEGLYQSSTTGMPQIAGIPFTVVNAATNTFQVLWNAAQSNYTALSGSPAGATVKKIINPDQYSPGINVIDSIALGTTTVIVLTTVPNYAAGQTVSFRIPHQWGTTQLNAGQNPNIPGFVVYGTVTVVNGQTITVNIDSTNFTPFFTNIPVAAVSGLSFPQVVAVGDVNTGGGQQLVNSIPTSNGPTINGAFLNNTKYGFLIGPNTCLANAASGNTIAWRAEYFDYFSVPGTY